MLRLALLLALLAPAAAAQVQQTIYPGQTGDGLRASLVAGYKPTALNGDNDDLYAVVDRDTVNGQAGVVCVYTGLFLPFDCNPSCDPSQDVFNNGSGINQEHTFPQSFLNGGGSAPSESDLQHLFPTRVVVNADRGNLPYAEIPDAQTNRWYRFEGSQTSIPDPSIIDEFSELRTNISFEPREDFQGDVARALFYIQTMYDPETTDSWFFPQMRQLYLWHYGDPVTADEYTRTFQIAPFQSNKPNPFILDSTLIRRAFFPQIATADEPGVPTATATLSAPAPNPSTGTTRFVLTAPARPERVRVEAFSVLGRRVAVLFDGVTVPGAPLALTFYGRGLPPGAYVVRATGETFRTSRRIILAH